MNVSDPKLYDKVPTPAIYNKVRGPGFGLSVPVVLLCGYALVSTARSHQIKWLK